MFQIHNMICVYIWQNDPHNMLTSITTHAYKIFFLVMGIFKISSLSNLEIYTTDLFIIVITLYLTSLGFIYLITGSFYLMTFFTHFTHLCIFLIWKESKSFSFKISSLEDKLCSLEGSCFDQLVSFLYSLLFPWPLVLGVFSFHQFSLLSHHLSARSPTPACLLGTSLFRLQRLSSPGDDFLGSSSIPS